MKEKKGYDIFMFTEKEKKLILTYYRLTKLCVPYLLAAFLSAIILLPMEMIDHLIFFNQKNNFIPMCIVLGIVGINVSLYAYATLRVRWGMHKGKTWIYIMDKLESGQIETKNYTGKAVWVNRSEYKETKKGDIFYLVYINNKLAGHYPASKFELP